MRARPGPRGGLPAVIALDAESRVRARVEARLAAELALRERTRLRVDDQRWVYELVGREVGDERHAADTSDDWELIWRRVFAAVTPLGPLAEHLADPDVEEVRINGTRSCFVFRQGCRESVPPPFDNEDALTDLVHWYTDGAGGARLDRASPMVTLTLPEGSRLHAALSPPARPMSVTIRRHPADRFPTLESLERSGFLPNAVIPFLEAAVEARLNILVAGGAGAGKTTDARPRRAAHVARPDRNRRGARRRGARPPRCNGHRASGLHLHHPRRQPARYAAAAGASGAAQPAGAERRDRARRDRAHRRPRPLRGLLAIARRRSRTPAAVGRHRRGDRRRPPGRAGAGGLQRGLRLAPRRLPGRTARAGAHQARTRHRPGPLAGRLRCLTRLSLSLPGRRWPSRCSPHSRRGCRSTRCPAAPGCAGAGRDGGQARLRSRSSRSRSGARSSRHRRQVSLLSPCPAPSARSPSCD
ncbi:MAG: hypothetical protein E6I42_10210 [Chloroflexi bacterium]|nr:MAG: hypothetical protein E6I42_10210 [Chloroflexota bacterium]